MQSTPRIRDLIITEGKRQGYSCLVALSQNKDVIKEFKNLKKNIASVSSSPEFWLDNLKFESKKIKKLNTGQKMSKLDFYKKYNLEWLYSQSIKTKQSHKSGIYQAFENYLADKTYTVNLKPKK